MVATFSAGPINFLLLAALSTGMTVAQPAGSACTGAMATLRPDRVTRGFCFRDPCRARQAGRARAGWARLVCAGEQARSDPRRRVRRTGARNPALGDDRGR